MPRRLTRCRVLSRFLSCIALLAASSACTSTDRAQSRSSRNTIVVSETDAASFTRVEDLIVGRLPGVEVVYLSGGSPSLRVRGRSRMQGQVEPLYVIDGTITSSGSLFGLNPADIKEISILKGAEAAIYGHRAGDAVLVVTTHSAGSSYPISDPPEAGQ